MATPTLAEAIAVAQRKAFVVLDGTLLRIDRVGMADGRDRPFYAGKHKCDCLACGCVRRAERQGS